AKEVPTGKEEELDEGDFRSLVGRQRRGHPCPGASERCPLGRFLGFQIYVSNVDIFSFGDSEMTVAARSRCGPRTGVLKRPSYGAHHIGDCAATQNRLAASLRLRL